jgi:hypothetical protein
LNTIPADGTTVEPGDMLVRVTADSTFLADQVLKKTLKIQIETAQGALESHLVERLTGILDEVKDRSYPDLKQIPIRSTIPGNFFLLREPNEIVEKDEIIGGVFDFKTAHINVSKNSVDRQQQRKLKTGQSGTAKIDLDYPHSVSFPVKMTINSLDRMVFEPVNMSDEHKRQMTAFLFKRSADVKLNANISVKVGTRSWMNLMLQ